MKPSTLTRNRWCPASATRAFVIAGLLTSWTFLTPRAILCQDADPRAEVEAAILAFGRAFLVADSTALDALLTEDYVHINGRSGSQLSRSEWLNWIGTRRTELESSELLIEAYEIDELSIHVYGTAAVVTGVWHSQGTRGGEPFSSSVRFSNYWVRDGGHWRRAAFHDTPLSDD